MAGATKTNLKKPCNDCPFRRNAAQGWLGAAEPAWFVESALADYTYYGFAPCHQTVNYEDPEWDMKLDQAESCVGALQFAANCGKSPRDPDRAEAVAKAGKNPDVFSNPNDFIEHHESGLAKSWLISKAR